MKFILLLILLFVVAIQAPADMRKAPYLIYTGQNTAIEVDWQLTSTAVCSVEWGTDTSYALGSQQTQEYGSDHQHRFTVPALMPGHRYFYRVTANQQTYAGTFRTAPDSTSLNISFFAYGDSRSYPATHDSVANGMLETAASDSNYQSLILSVGDLVADGNYESYWDNELFSPVYSHIQALLRDIPYQSCRGNHEGTGTLFAKYFPYPCVPGHYWSFDYGPAHFAVLDQFVSYSPGSAQLAWLTSDLATSSRPWKFIVLHEPGWSAGGGHANSLNVQAYIQPLCEQYGVAIVFGGHNHYYSRAVVNGVQHITAGGGGAPLHSPDPTYPCIVTVSRAHHYCRVEIDGSLLRLIAVALDGTVIDTVSISRPIPGVPGDLTISPLLSPAAIRLDWLPVNSDTSGHPLDISRYVIFRSADLTQWDSIGVPVPSDTTWYVDSTQFGAGSKYFYRVRAVSD